MELDANETVQLLERAADGDQASLATVLNANDARLSRMIALRIDPRISARIDVSDVIQEVHIEAWQHLPEYMRNPAMPFYLWLRGVAGNKLLELHRRHLGTKMRDARREVSFDRPAAPETSSVSVAAYLIDSVTSVSSSAMRGEVKDKLIAAVNKLHTLDREVLALRHFEQLSPAESAQVLQISEKAAGMRYLRALKRLKEVLSGLSEGLSELRLPQ